MRTNSTFFKSSIMSAPDILFQRIRVTNKKYGVKREERLLEHFRGSFHFLVDNSVVLFLFVMGT